MVSNKKAGTDFEREFAVLIAAHGFWVHMFQDNKNGQPCDVVASRNGITYLFDCKDCKKDYFLLSRMEENQYNAMHLFELTGNEKGKFALRFSNQKIYLIDYDLIRYLQSKGIKQIDEAVCESYGSNVNTWLGNFSESAGDESADSSWQ
ncbi:MAG TPA: hypothetical protein DEQ64_11275 [Lachnoclostridium sp.]|jgi:Holliday junction resolvase|uniref:Holliday junction resolvase RecU n=1 Tax=Lacrimispora sp. TaxID=2719234 RepID=UPI000EBCD137|nr:Holliday junction resolvase RecU [Lacrimispora sp.]HCD44296.1 hypothetical protein [Lachnoclostridium sp.]